MNNLTQPQGAVPAYRITSTKIYQTALKAYMPAHMVECNFGKCWRFMAYYANRASAEVVVKALRATAEDTTWAKYNR